MSDRKLTHFDKTGKVKMVDISHKQPTERLAKAAGKILLKKSTVKLLKEKALTKGDAIATAKIAGILAAKKVSELIPLTHPLNITYCDLQFEIKSTAVVVTSEVKMSGRTGPDIEAITSVAVALLTIYDMVKSVDRSATLTEIHLLEKSGGKSGNYCRSEKLPRM
ncbi:MAG: cyclic pyranopterin monophosphate synthase MoaC [Elusimicrobiota bacterium]